MKLLLAIAFQILILDNLTIARSIKDENAEVGGKLIAQKDYKAAQKFFDKKEKDELELAPEMIKNAYSYGISQSENRSEIISSIDEFVRSFEPERIRAASYAALLDALESDNQMSNIIVIEISFFMRREAERSGSKAMKDRNYLTYDTDEKSYVDPAVESLAIELRRKDYKQVKKVSGGWAGAFDFIIPKLVRKAYNGDPENFDAVFEVKQELFWLSHQERLVKTLHEEVLKNPSDKTPELLEKLRPFVRTQGRLNGY